MALSKYILESAYARILLTEGRKDIIVNKIGLPEHLAEYFVKYYDKRFVLYWASAFGQLIDRYKESRLMKPDVSYSAFKSTQFTSTFKELEQYIKMPELPKLSKDILNQFKKQEGDNHLRLAMELVEKYITIYDYVDRTNQNLQNKDFSEAYEEAQEWHDNLETSGNTIELEGDMEVIHKFEDGYYWVDNHDSSCEIEGDAMGHCGRTSADTILSLRSPDGEPHVSVAFNYDSGVYTQAKGKQNKKPVEKYHKYMEWLFTNGGKYQIKGYRSEYQGSQDFKLEDLPEDIQEEVLEKYPQYDPKHQLRKLLEANISPEGKVQELMKLSTGQDDDPYNFNVLNYSEDFGMFYIHTPKDSHEIESWAYRGDDKLEFYIGVIQEGFVDIDTTYVEPESFFNYSLDSKYDMEHEDIKKLLNVAREEDPDRYFEVLAEVNDDNDVEEIIVALYEAEFPTFNDVIDDLIRRSYENEAYDEIYTDIKNFLEDVPFEHQTGNDYEMILDMDDRSLIEVIQDNHYYIGGTIDTLIQMALDTNPEYDYFEDYIREFYFDDTFNPPYYGYPTTISKETVSYMLDEIEDLIGMAS